MGAARPDRRPAPVERASSADLGMRAMDARSPVPQHVGAVLVLEPGAAGPAELDRVLRVRAAAVPRLRQRLLTLPPGFGRPVWVDAPDLDVGAHIRHVRCPGPGDERALLDLAAVLVGERLPRSRPLWAAAVVSGLAGGRTGLVLVVHHVLADGLGGLAVLGTLLDPRPGDGEPAGAGPSAPRPRPPWGRLLADAVRSHRAALARAPETWRELRRALRAGGGLHPEAAAPCSLLAPTGDRNRFAVARTDLAPLRAAAHRYGGTVDDAVLGAVAGALGALLRARGETLDTVRVAVMVSARRTADPGELGNQVTPLLIGVPAGGTPGDRLRRIAGAVRRAREQASGPSVVTVLGPAFRWAARLGLYRAYMARQHRLHTLVSDLRGPAEPVTLAGRPVSAIVPVAVGESGDVTVSFVALSYAGRLTVTVVADSAVPDLEELVRALQGELDALVADPVAGAR